MLFRKKPPVHKGVAALESTLDALGLLKPKPKKSRKKKFLVGGLGAVAAVLVGGAFLKPEDTP